MNIMRFRPVFFVLSLILIAVSIFSIIRWQFKSSIDFSGGSVWELSAPQEINSQNLQNIFQQQDIELLSVTTIGQDRYQLKFEPVSNQQKDQLFQGLSDQIPGLEELSFQTLSPILGKELLRKTIVAVVLSSVTLLLFIGSRFKDLTFGFSALLAMFHDTFILIGSFSLLGHFFGAQLDTLFVTAVLTTLSASVHDAIVTFDRIRELRRQDYKTNWVQLANKAVTETLTRSINNSMTIIFMLLSLVLLGGSTTQWFSVALLIGAILGTYSSVGVAIPLVLFFKRKKQ